MNKQELLELRADIMEALNERYALGEFDANSKHIIHMLSGIVALVDHAISQYPKPSKKK